MIFRNIPQRFLRLHHMDHHSGKASHPFHIKGLFLQMLHHLQRLRSGEHDLHLQHCLHLQLSGIQHGYEQLILT